MIIFFAFIALWLGLSFSKNYLVFGILILLFLLYVTKRSNKKITIFALFISLVGFGISFINVSYSSENFKAIVYEAKENYVLVNSGGERLYVSLKDHSYDVADIVNIKGEKTKIEFPKYESSFDFAQYLSNKGVFNEIINPKIHLLLRSPVRIRTFQSWFISKFSKDAQLYVGGILFSNYNENESSSLIKGAHLTRLISASGIYVYAFSLLIENIAKLKLSNKTTDKIVIGFLFCYSLITCFKFSVVKILSMKIFSLINNYYKKEKIIYISQLSIIGIFFLLLNRYLAYQDSFILGFTIPIFFFLARDYLNKFSKFKSKIISTFLLFLFFIPFELKYNNSVNLLAIPIQTLLIPGFILFSLFAISTFVFPFLITIINFIGMILNKCTIFMTRFNFSIYGDPFNGFELLLYYSILLALIYYVTIGFKPIFKRLKLVYIIAISLNFLPIDNLFLTTVSFINVGQGDACLIQKGTANILIDTGGSIYKDIAVDCLIPYFKKNKIYNIDLVITTHNDNDHSGALNSLYENFYIKKYINQKDSFPIKVGDITLVNYNIFDFTNENDNSLVIGFNISGNDFLIMGDASIDVERKLIQSYKNIPCDYLKVGHHGSDTSTCDDFIKFIKPKVAIVSVGKNYYGHPSKKVLSTLLRNNVIIKRTDISGTYKVRSLSFL